MGVGYQKSAWVPNNFVSDKDEEQNLRMTEIGQQNLFEFGELPDLDNWLSDEKSNEEWSEYDFTQKKISFTHGIQFLPFLIVQIRFLNLDHFIV